MTVPARHDLPGLLEVRTSAGIAVRVGSYWKGDGYVARKVIALGRDNRDRPYARMLGGGSKRNYRTWVLITDSGPGASEPLDEATGRLVLSA